MTKQALVIVESPTKAKTIRKFLPKNFLVESSMGHVRDLPQSAADIPEKLKGEEWAKLGVNVNQNFEPIYVVLKGKFQIIQNLKKKLALCDELYLATDEDREGEAISWHLAELLKPKVPVRRMVFHEITKSAIDHAIKDVRAVDLRLVHAQEARRVLDRLVGYTLSPLIWKKIAYGLSAGRVQSVGLRLIVIRERERIAFQSATYWDLTASLEKGSKFSARLHTVDTVRVASGKDFDEKTGSLKDGKDLRLILKEEAQKLSLDLKTALWKVIDIEEKTYNSKPPIPFITSTLQQEGIRKLGLSARDTMRSAQKLYEEGLITYMRTDSPNLSQEALRGSRACVENLYGKEYLSPEPRQFAAKTKGAQEAHEAIRPAGEEFKHPKETGLSGKELALYELIWMRTLATQMAEAQKLSMSVKIKAANTVFNATGTRILFPGFLRAYVEGSDDPESALEEKEVILPKLAIGDEVKLLGLDALSHETKPPARYTEASLVQMLEKEGIGRPSTYASIIDTIITRGYVRRASNALVPTFTGMAVVQLLERHFNPLVDVGFTSKMEQSLDEIAEGNLEWVPYLKAFYLGSDGLQAQVKRQDKKIDPEASRSVELAHLKDVKVKIGRYGAYVVEGEKTEELHATIPDDIAPADLSMAKIHELIEVAAKGPQSMGRDPKTSKNIYCLIGRFGPYVQLGEVTDENPKPKRAGLLKGMDPKTISLDEALHLLTLPRELGVHPISQKPILANQGRFGPYILHDGDFRSLKKEDNLFTVDLKRALEILSEEKKFRHSAASAIREIGEHPADKKPVAIYDGKYGMYIKYDKLNVTLPKELLPVDVTMQKALELIAEKQSTGSKKSTTRGKSK